MQWHNRRVGAGESEPRAELIATVVCPEWPNMMPVFHMPQQQRIKGRDLSWMTGACAVLCCAVRWRDTGKLPIHMCEQRAVASPTTGRSRTVAILHDTASKAGVVVAGATRREGLFASSWSNVWVIGCVIDKNGRQRRAFFHMPEHAPPRQRYFTPFTLCPTPFSAQGRHRQAPNCIIAPQATPKGL
jgi:hypothetical protein